MKAKTYHKNNFYRNTFCVFRLVEADDLPPATADYKSKTGSEYYFTEKGVYRISNHWGRAAGCRWRLNAIEYKQQQALIGYADWTAFFPNNEEQHLYFICQPSPDVFSFDHKYSVLYDGKSVLRSAADTSKVLKQIHDIQKNPSALKYISSDDPQQMISEIIYQLIYTNTSYAEIKRKLLNK